MKPSFCSPRIKEAFERQRVFLFGRGPSKLQAMLVLGCVVQGGGVGGVWDKSVDTGGRGRGRKTELLAPGREICYCMRGCWKEDSISSVHEEGEKKRRGGGKGVETVRWGYGRRQMDGGGRLKSVIESGGKREREA